MNDNDNDNVNDNDNDNAVNDNDNDNVNDNDNDNAVNDNVNDNAVNDNVNDDNEIINECKIENELISCISNCIQLIVKLSTLIDFESLNNGIRPSLQVPHNNQSLQVPHNNQSLQVPHNQKKIFFENEDTVHDHQKEQVNLYHSILLFIIDSCLKFTNTVIVENNINLFLKSIIVKKDEFELEKIQLQTWDLTTSSNVIDIFLILFIYFLLQELPISILVHRRLDLAVLEFSILYHFSLSDCESIEKVMSDNHIHEILSANDGNIQIDKNCLANVIQKSKLFTPILPFADSQKSPIETLLANLEEVLSGIYPFLFSSSLPKDSNVNVSIANGDFVFDKRKEALCILDLYLSLQFTHSSILDSFFIKKYD